MKRFVKLFAVLLVVLILASSLVACKKDPVVTTCEHNYVDGTCTKCGEADPNYVFVPQDYVSQLKLDMKSNTKKATVTVKTYIDGDTTHFNINDPSFPGGDVLKARYLAINTPESTGQIEPWGKAASDFTKGKLKSATSIIVESNDDKWNPDSTGSRYLVFVWYRTSETEEYRNLNLEIIQNGYARASNTMGNIYGTTCIAALNQAKTQKINVYSEEKDPNFYYGSAQYVSLRELRCNIEKYNLQKVAFDGIVTRTYDGGAYIENFDVESQLYYGMYVYLGNGANGAVLQAINIGNYVRVSGTVSEFNGSFQVSGVTSDAGEDITTEILESEDELPGFVRTKNGSNWYYQASYKLTDAATFNNSVVTLDMMTENEDGEETMVQKNFDYAYLALGTSVKFENLTVNRTYTTSKGTSQGAFTMYCKDENGVEITLRTVVLLDSSNNLVLASDYNHKTITVKGVVDFFQLDEDEVGTYQIKILNVRDIKIVND